MSTVIYDTGHVAVLEKKSKENYDCAKQACLARNYNAAISRLYYSCLLLTKRGLFEFGITNESKLKKIRQDQHTFIIDNYVNPLIADSSIPGHIRISLVYIKTIRKNRRKADYSPYYDYSIASNLGDYNSCEQMAVDYIKALESIHHIKII